jgi:hypothetical protein
MRSHILTSLLRRTVLALVLVGLGFGLVAHALQGKKKAGDGSALALLAAFRDDAADELTSDNGSGYTHGVDGQITLGKPDTGRFRMDLTTFNANGRQVNIDLSACGADCDNLNGPHVEFLQSGAAFTRTMTGWTTSGTALNFRTMRVLDGVRYAHLQVELAKDGKLKRRFNFSAAEHPIEAWQCNDPSARPASVACTAEDQGGTCVRWELEGRNGCFRKALDNAGSAWSSTFVEDVAFQLILTPAP